MRIVAGEFRGRAIEAPQGEGTRPTIDRVREALFSSLFSMRGGFEGAVVLDAFAGSGALGLEAISRGAKQVVFCENDQKAAKVCERNARSLGLDARRAVLLCRDTFDVASLRHGELFDLVLLDPPYSYDPQDVVSLVSELKRSGLLTDDAIIVYEHAHSARNETAAAVEAAGFQVIANKKYGKTGITMWRASTADENGSSKLATEKELL